VFLLFRQTKWQLNSLNTFQQHALYMSLSRAGMVLFLAFGLLNPCWGATVDRIETTILEASVLEIHGRSNIADFTCRYSDPIAPDTLVYGVSFADSIYVREAPDISLEVEAFDCGNWFITRDLRRTLQSDFFPKMFLSPYQVELADTTPFSARIHVSIAGVRRLCMVTIEDIVHGATGLQVRGVGQIDLSTFSIRPVSSIWRLVRVDERIDIAFDLLLR
jgi:hypothetical protein